MKRKKNSGEQMQYDYEIIQECTRQIEDEYSRAAINKKTQYGYKDGSVEKVTTIIHRQSKGAILLTAISFFLVGAMLCAAFILAGKVFDGIFSFGGTSLNSGVLNEIYERNVSGVVLISSVSTVQDGMVAENIGTGFFVTEDGYILTNEHVVRDATDIAVKLFDGTEHTATLVGKDILTDVAVLHIDGNGYNALSIGDSSSVRTGDFVMAIGHPTGIELAFTATYGNVSAIARDINIDGKVNNYIQIDAALNPGNSGGPLFDINGNVIGMNTAKTTAAGHDDDGELISAEGLGYALPISKVMELYSNIIASGTGSQPGLGLQVITIEPERAQYYNIPVGVLVYTVTKDGPADKAGLYPNDIITSVDGVTITTSDEFIAIVRSHKVGDSLRIGYQSGDESKECIVTLIDFNDIGDEILDNFYGGAIYGY